MWLWYTVVGGSWVARVSIRTWIKYGCAVETMRTEDTNRIKPHSLLGRNKSFSYRINQKRKIHSKKLFNFVKEKCCSKKQPKPIKYKNYFILKLHTHSSHNTFLRTTAVFLSKTNTPCKYISTLYWHQKSFQTLFSRVLNKTLI